MFFESVAYALGAAPDGGTGGGAAGILGGPLPMLVLMFAIFYFLLIRPQQKKAKEHKNMIEALTKGTKVWTNGGILGTIVDIDGDNLTLEIAEGVNIVIKRSFVLDTFKKPGDVKDKKKDKK